MLSSKKHLRGYIMVMIAACLWATLGLFYRVLSEEYGLSKGVIVTYRAGIAALVLVSALALFRRQHLHVRRQDWLYFLLFGSVGVAAFYLCYIQATTTGPLAVAAVLLYTAPIWITGWAMLRQGEELTLRRAVALLLAVGGCALVADIFNHANLAVNGTALIFGLLSGLTYAAYSVWSAEGTRRGYNAWTVVAYSLGIGALVLVAVQPVNETLRPLELAGAWPYLLGVALGPTVLAPACFTIGLQYVRTSNASILATAEPVVAALLGWIVVVPPEPLNGWQLVGGAAVLGAVIVLTTARREPRAAGGDERGAEEAKAGI